MKKIIVSLLLLLNVYGLHAQIQAKYEMAEDYYNRLAFSKAIPLLVDYLAKKSDNLDARILLADCYRQNNEYAKAEEQYAIIAADSRLMDEKQKLYYAQILQTNQKYDQAAKAYENYLVKFPDDQRAQNQLQASKNMSQFATDNKFIIVDMPFNTDGYDFGACLLKDRFFYTSTGGKTNNDAKKKNLWTGEAFMDLYQIQIAENDEGDISFSAPSPMDKTLNSKYNEGPLCFNKTGDKVYFTRNEYNPQEKEKLEFSKEKQANLNIYEASTSNNVWSNVKKLPFNNKEYSCGDPALDVNTNTLYFISNMPGGFGGTDIWKVTDSNGVWSKPVNLGATINTEGDEMFPFLAGDNTLYFASDGHGGLGGLDIFSCKLSGNTVSDITNIGTPINTSYDDFGYLVNDDKTVGFFSSNRPGGKGEDDIYRFVSNTYELDVLVVDKTTQLPIPASNVLVKLDSKTVAELVSNMEGASSTKVEGGLTYHLDANAKNYLPDSISVTISQDKNSRIRKVKLELTPLLMQILVIDAVTKNPIPNATVNVRGNCMDAPKDLQTDNDGNTVSMKTSNGCDYALQANAKGYLPKSMDVQLRNLTANYKAVIELDPITEKPIVLNNIYYDFDKWFIRKESEEDLNMLLQFIKSNPEAILELSSHTDARGDDNYNMKLSQKRAQSVVDWLIARGVDKSKIKPVGYGETKPVNACTNNVKCTEEEHQRNRRTEFRVLNAGQVTASQVKQNIIIAPCKKCPF